MEKRIGILILAVALLIVACQEQADRDAPSSSSTQSSMSEFERKVNNYFAERGALDTIINEKGDTLFDIKKEVKEKLMPSRNGTGWGIVARKDGKRPQKTCVRSDDSLKTDSSKNE